MGKAVDNQLIRIVVTGPESTGKTVLCERLAKHYGVMFIPEYAREYVQNLKKKYTYEDVIHIANRQLELEKEYVNTSKEILFYDTYLLITKVWFEVVYKECPGWIENVMISNNIDLFLLCAPDIPWIPDGIRENGGEMREWLFEEYRKQLERYQCAYKIIVGTRRFESAKEIINELIRRKSKNRE